MPVVTIEHVSGGKIRAAVGENEMLFGSILSACKWVDAVCYKIQPAECLIYGGCCGYPIEDCKNCPCHPVNKDPYWGLTRAVIRNG